MTSLLLTIIILLGIFLRFANLSPFKFYPDAYQNLIVAQNMSIYHSVFGRLGEAGMFYPYFFMWTRPIYAGLINIVNFLTQDPSTSALVISLICGILAIPASFLLIKKVFSSSSAGLIGALLTAISFNSIVWGGFIYTESLGVLLVLLLLWRLFNGLGDKSIWADQNDFLIGSLLTLAIFTRYEYLVLIIPLVFMVLQKNPFPERKLINIFTSSAFLASIILNQYFPISEIAGLIFMQLQDLLVLGGIFLIGAVFFLVLKKMNKLKLEKFRNFNLLITGFFWVLAVFLVLQSLPGNPAGFLFNDLAATRNFFGTDFLLGAAGVVGITLMLKKSPDYSVIYFVLISIFLLFPIYYKINPTMQRYITHLLPFLLIPASFAGWKILNLIQKNIQSNKYRALLISALVLLGLQTFVSLRGIRYWHDGSWFRISYEEKSARILKGKLPAGSDNLLISSLPEAYYFHTNRSTQSILENDQFPFLSIDPALDSRGVYIIADMGMSDVFPNFDNFLNSNLEDRKISEYWVNENYRFSSRLVEENRPVRIYEIKLSELKEKINQAYQPQGQ